MTRTKKFEKRVTACRVCGGLCEADKEAICFDLATGETLHMRCNGIREGQESDQRPKGASPFRPS